ncbi:MULTISPECIES: secA translation cis-regulator SecM [Providencia]|uniref:Secretion monitor n=1 Tax=Providencia huashanensis TaxID=3037798 RepID=A0AA42FRT0_9GAMM|nr:MULTISPECIES: secA translation cis-regulator SecM [Providencia]MBC8653066.1 secA regulator SecM [Providencia vermicola]HCI98032.1 secA regulator SecM [Providencia sp.]APC12695.1 Secretion monitor precursor [Providencia rettgeri]AVL72228.1 secA regulator SecM [Providencia rettgeri]EIL1982053.1 secA regulator SecM [Providencia rettgeri]
MGILNFWRQLGRKYFWSHLLLGVVATGVGLPTILNALSESQLTQINSSPVNRQSQAVNAFDNLFAQQNSQRSSSSSSFSVNYWQQHAVRNVIRQLTFAFSATEDDDASTAKKESEQLIVPQLMLDTLYAMLAQRSLQWDERIVQVNHYDYPHFISYQPAMWVAQVHGIRAGPLTS